MSIHSKRLARRQAAELMRRHAEAQKPICPTCHGEISPHDEPGARVCFFCRFRARRAPPRLIDVQRKVGGR